MSKRVALITGATGVVGRNLLAHLLQTGGWDIFAVSRRSPALQGDYVHLVIDLLDPADCARQAHRLSAVTHVFHAAYVERSDSAAWVNDNTAMLSHLIEAIDPVALGLEHVHVMHGTKWYGNHHGTFRTPAREDDPRHMPPNFYYNQWDYLTQASRDKRWSISSARPHAICGDGVGSPMNLPMVLAVYAALSRELGLPLQFPGSAANYHALYQVTDATLLARAMVWMSTEPSCANQAFNITNGDLIRWENFWPKMAEYWGMELAPRRPIRLAQAMADKGPLWDQMVARYRLRATSYPDLVSWGYGDFVFASDFDIISHTGKCRRYGFYEFEDTEAMFFRLWDQYRAAGILPG